jgi:hypothetical protein
MDKSGEGRKICLKNARTPEITAFLFRFDAIHA